MSEAYVHDVPRSQDDIERKRTIVLNQQMEIIGQGTVEKVTCVCGFKLPTRLAYRCYFCGIFLCQTCAANHFGKRPLMAMLESEGE